MKVVITSLDFEKILQIDEFIINEGFDIAHCEHLPVSELNFGIPEIVLLLEGMQSVLDIFCKIKEMFNSYDEVQDTEVQKGEPVTFTIINAKNNSHILINTSMTPDEVVQIIQKLHKE